jgi:hypothetical protein
MNYTDKIKDIKDIDKLSTKRLLAYYKARRKDRISFERSHTCDLCGELDWNCDSSKEEHSKKSLNEYRFIEQHLKEVKELLSKREHVRR